MSQINGNVATARVSAAEEDRIARAQRQADALAYLTRKNQLDVVAEALGLVPSTAPKRQPRRRGVA